MSAYLHALGLMAIVSLGVSGCSETASNDAMTPSAQSMRSGSPADESACMTAVARETKNSEVVVISSEFSQANTTVVVGVGPQKAKWRCLVSKGRVAEVMSLTDEGAL